MLAHAIELAGGSVTPAEAGRLFKLNFRRAYRHRYFISPSDLTALGLFTAQILMGLLLSVGYNPIRQWPRQRWIKLFTFHNWLGYIGLATAACCTR